MAAPWYLEEWRTVNKPTDRTVFQNAWVVDDVEAACMKWVNEMGVGPFFVTEYTDQFSDMTYRGEPAELSMFVAIAQAGPVQIELIQPTVERCAYRDSVPAGTMGFHHMCVWTHDIKADTAYFAGLGYEAANLGRAGDIEFAYYDTRPLMGCMLEVGPQSPGIVERLAAIAAAAEGWNGKDPIRS
ncbi:MAG: VOC family protein [Gammaproteobacteria bacterium]|nr:VOC family protein [Gammaproteobacteria bacterium]